MRVKIAKWGNSLGLRLPKAAVQAAGFAVGSDVDIEVQGRELRLSRPLPAKHYRLEDLIAEMDRLGPENRPELVDWGPDVGAEVIDDGYSRGLIPAPGGRSRLDRSQSNAGTGAGRRKAGRRSQRS